MNFLRSAAMEWSALIRARPFEGKNWISSALVLMIFS